jgi:hypothetical protein
VTKLVCSDCQHENEPERIYCHNCGARLDRSAVAREKVAEDVDAGTQKHLKKMFDSGSGRAGRAAIMLGKVLLGACATAALIEMILPPDLPPPPKSYGFAPMIGMDMVSAISSHQTASLVYSEEQVNSYIGSNLRRKDSPAKEGVFPLLRIFVQFQEGICGINTERQFYGLSIYSGSSYRVAISNGKISSEATGGYIGRMPIHPKLIKYADVLLQKAWDSLARERNSVAKLAGIEFHPQSVTLIVAR